MNNSNWQVNAIFDENNTTWESNNMGKLEIVLGKVQRGDHAITAIVGQLLIYVVIAYSGYHAVRLVLEAYHEPLDRALNVLGFIVAEMVFKILTDRLMDGRVKGWYQFGSALLFSIITASCLYLNMAISQTVHLYGYDTLAGWQVDYLFFVFPALPLIGIIGLIITYAVDAENLGRIVTAVEQAKLSFNAVQAELERARANSKIALIKIRQESSVAESEAQMEHAKLSARMQLERAKLGTQADLANLQAETIAEASKVRSVAMRAYVNGDDYQAKAERSAKTAVLKITKELDDFLE